MERGGRCRERGHECMAQPSVAEDSEAGARFAGAVAGSEGSCGERAWVLGEASEQHGRRRAWSWSGL